MTVHDCIRQNVGQYDRVIVHRNKERAILENVLDDQVLYWGFMEGAAKNYFEAQNDIDLEFECVLTIII